MRLHLECMGCQLLVCYRETECLGAFCNGFRECRSCAILEYGVWQKIAHFSEQARVWLVCSCSNSSSHPIKACVWQRDLHGGELFLEENKLNSLFAFGLYEVLDAKWPCDHIHHQ